MHPKYPHMFTPIRLGPVQLRNRFFFSPHGVHLTVGSKPSNDYVHYQAERVAGGCGLVICSMTSTERGRTTQPSPYPDENIASLAALADRVHELDGKIFAQIWYHWTAPGSWQSYSPAAPCLAASRTQFSFNGRTVSTHEMAKDEIRESVEAIRRSTANLESAGFDGVMLHASHGGLIEQFLSPYFNQRTDEYGGSVPNRMRFLLESLEAARNGGGGKIAVGMRLNCDELLPGGYGSDYAREVVTRTCEAGLLDYVDLDIAVEPNQLHLGMPPAFVEKHVYRPYVEAVRSAARDVPVLSVLGRVRTIAEAEEAIAAGVCDVVGAARALIAEPELVNNAFNGREDRSRTCIACNWCLAASTEGAQGCTVNPASYRERFWGMGTFTPATRRSKVIVVGGGPGGMEAARTSALRGHEVFLLERQDRLGGGLALWAKLPGRAIIQDSIDWWARELQHLGVNLRLGVEATAHDILADKPDAVILATGAPHSASGRSAFLDRDIPGHDRRHVYRPEDILLGDVRLTGKVVVLDCEGLHAGLGVAELVGMAGAEVEYLSPNLSPLSSRLVGSFEARFVMQRLRAAGVRISTSTYVRSIGEGEVTAYDVYTDDAFTIDSVSAVVLCTARIPENGLEKQLQGRIAQLFPVGDALAARVFATASYEGQKFARYIGEAGAPGTFAEAFFRRNPRELSPSPAESMKGA